MFNEGTFCGVPDIISVFKFSPHFIKQVWYMWCHCSCYLFEKSGKSDSQSEYVHSMYTAPLSPPPKKKYRDIRSGEQDCHVLHKPYQSNSLQTCSLENTSLHCRSVEVNPACWKSMPMQNKHVAPFQCQSQLIQQSKLDWTPHFFIHHRTCSLWLPLVCSITE